MSTVKPEKPKNERDSVVQENSDNAKKATTAKKKPAKKRNKATTAKSKRRKPTTKPLAKPEPAPAPLTLEELKEQGREAKQELVNAVVEPGVGSVETNAPTRLAVQILFCFDCWCSHSRTGSKNSQV